MFLQTAEEKFLLAFNCTYLHSDSHAHVAFVIPALQMWDPNSLWCLHFLSICLLWDKRITYKNKLKWLVILFTAWFIVVQILMTISVVIELISMIFLLMIWCTTASSDSSGIGKRRAPFNLVQGATIITIITCMQVYS